MDSGMLRKASTRLLTPILGLALTLASGARELAAQVAKPPFERSLWVGIHAGADASRFTFVPRIAQRWYLAPKAGARLRLDVERGASVQIEANWTGLGWTERYDDPEIHYTRAFTTIEVPILAHLYLGQRAVRLFINAGPSVGYYISETSVARGQERFTPTQQLRHSLPLRNKLSWGLTGGLGLSVGIAQRHRLEVEGRLLYGFGDIWSSRRADPYGQSSPMAIGASLSYLFKI